MSGFLELSVSVSRAEVQACFGDCSFGVVEVGEFTCFVDFIYSFLEILVGVCWGVLSMWYNRKRLPYHMLDFKPERSLGVALALIL